MDVPTYNDFETLITTLGGTVDEWGDTTGGVALKISSTRKMINDIQPAWTDQQDIYQQIQ